MEITPIAVYHGEFKQKFGIPRQSGLIDLKGQIAIDKKFADPNAFREIEQFSHLWIIWGFDTAEKNSEFSPTVRPPRLGGNRRIGVFATRSPFRPNSLGLSSVKLESVDILPDGIFLNISGADLSDNTPIYDIKPYIPYTDSHPDAEGGFSKKGLEHKLQVVFEKDVNPTKELREKTEKILSLDPRPAYQEDENRIYNMVFENHEIKFTISGNIATVTKIKKTEDPNG